MSHSPFYMQAGRLRAKVRADYDILLEAQIGAAMEATNGNLRNRRGREAGVDSWSLFSGSDARAKAYASEELVDWWAANGRTTFEAFERQAFDNMMSAPVDSEAVLPDRATWEAQRRERRDNILALRSQGFRDREIAERLDLPLAKVRNAIQYAQRKAKNSV